MMLSIFAPEGSQSQEINWIIIVTLIQGKGTDPVNLLFVRRFYRAISAI